MNDFSGMRFMRALQNDVVNNAKRIGIATLVLMLIGGGIYLIKVSSDYKVSGLEEKLFAIVLLGGGLLFTSLSWSDMHHSLARFHYLMLPYSNLERFLSRYVLTAPLYYLYTVLAFKVFEVLANALCQSIYGASVPVLQLDSWIIVYFTLLFFWVQPLVFAGAIYFRNFVLPRTLLTLLLGIWLLGAVMQVTIRLLYRDIFTSWWTTNAEIWRMTVLQDMSSTLANNSVVFQIAAIAAALWALCLAWLFLNDHEVQDGL